MAPLRTLGRYEITERLSRGGMGVVYLANDPHLHRTVVVKVLSEHLDQPGLRERFVREARAAAVLAHPNIVTIHDYGELDDEPFIVMEYIRGETLREIINRQAPIPLDLKLAWLEQLCSGLRHAHRVGIIHRDIKPPNLIVDQHQSLKILDFGIARVSGVNTTTSGATQFGVALGTYGYMSPEQLRGHGVDARSDLFSVGIVAYELLTYQRAFAFDGDSYAAIERRVLFEEPKDILELASDVPPVLAAVVRKALAKAPDDRQPDADTLLTEFQEIRGRARPLTPAPLSSRTPVPIVSARPTSSSGVSASAAAAAHSAGGSPPASQLTAARRAHAIGDYETALMLVDEILRRDPGDRDAWALRSAIVAGRTQVLTPVQVREGPTEVNVQASTSSRQTGRGLPGWLVPAALAFLAGAVAVAVVVWRPFSPGSRPTDSPTRTDTARPAADPSRLQWPRAGSAADGSQVSNVEFAPDSRGEGAVVITYDLRALEQPEATFDVSLEIFPTAGDARILRPTAVTGDVGSRQRAGLRKRMVWVRNGPAEADLDLETLGLRVRARVAAVPSPLTARAVTPTAPAEPPVRPVVSDTDRAAAETLRGDARRALAGGDVEQAAELFERALKLNPASDGLRNDRNRAVQERETDRRASTSRLIAKTETSLESELPDYDAAIADMTKVLSWFPDDKRAADLKARATKARDAELKRKGRGGGVA